MKAALIPTLLCLLFSCNSGEVKIPAEKPPKPASNTYKNAAGVSITLSRQNDSVMRAILKDSTGRVFETTMKIEYDSKISELMPGHKTDTFPFLRYHMGWGGIMMVKDTLIVCEFSNIAAMQCESLMPVYEPFVRIPQ